MDCSSTSDQSFGPVVSSCWRTFDFTLLFEDIFFQLVPSCLFLIITAPRVAVLLRASPRLPLSTPKIIATATYAALQVVALVLICKHGQINRTSSSISAASISLVAALALVVLSYLQETRSKRPSFLIAVYLCISVLLRSATVRTYWLLDSYKAVASVALVGVIAQLSIILLESFSKKQNSVNKSQNISNEECASFLGRTFFIWLNKLFITGYWRELTADDLQPIDSVLNSSRLDTDFDDFGEKYKAGRFRLPVETLRCLGIYSFAPILPRLCLTGFTFAQPFLITALIKYFGSPEVKIAAQGYGLIGASFLVYFGMAVSTGWYWHLAYKCIAKVRGGLIGIISRKMMRLKKEKSLEAKVLTLMISDVQRIVGGLAYCHELWVAPVETAIATWLLWRQIGPSSLTVLGIALLSTVGSTYIGKNIGTQQQVWLAATEKRISATKKMLSSMKAIKMLGASERVGEGLERLRNFEFAASKMFRTLIIGTVFSSYSTLTLAPVVAFGAYIGAARATNEEFNASRMFPSLILITLLASPLIRLLQIIPSLGAAMGCFARLEKFLELSEEIQPRGLQADKTHKLKTEMYPENTSDLNLEKASTTPIISIRNGFFGWGVDPCLQDIKLDVQRGEHVIITGPVGCGKSLLLQAILGEVKPIKGSVHLGSQHIGYCGQLPWLENITARENAFRCAESDEVWEQAVIEACALDSFLKSQIAGDTVGNGGARISGGERQRLALARAIAFRPAILLLDDISSAIDMTTNACMRRKLFGPKGLLRKHGITIVQIAQDLSFATEADKHFKIDENGLVEPVEIINSIKFTSEDEIIVTEMEMEIPVSPTTVPTKASMSTKKDKSSVANIADKKVYQIYFGSIGYTNILIFFVCASTFAFTLKFPDVWAKWWSEASTEKSAKGLGYWLGLYSFLSFLPLLTISLWVAQLMLRIVPRSGVGLHTKLLNTVLSTPFAFLSTIDSGSIINRFNQDLMFVDTKLPLDLLNTTSSLFTCIAQIILVVVATIYLLAALPVLALILVILQHFYLRTSKQLRQLDLQSKAGLQSKISETLEGLTTIRAHGWQRTYRSEFWEKLDRSQEPFYLLFLVQTYLRFVLNLVVTGLSVTVVGIAVATRHQTSASGIGVAFLNLVSLGETMTNLITSWTSLETSLGAIARIQSFEDDTPREAEVKEQIDVPADWPTAGKLIVKDVRAGYHHEIDYPVWKICDITFQVNAGEKIAICGRSGAGKSTLLLLLLGLIETEMGTILLDGIDISLVKRSLLRSRLHVISQDTFIHGDSIRDALSPEGNPSDEVIEEILRETGLLDKINISGGLSTSFNDINLSAGETQLFILARTLIQARNKRGGLVLLDEAISSIDVATEKRIKKLLQERLVEYTILSIMHRLESALEFDRILVIEDGKIESFGTPEETLKNSKLFKELLNDV